MPSNADGRSNCRRGWEWYASPRSSRVQLLIFFQGGRPLCGRSSGHGFMPLSFCGKSEISMTTMVGVHRLYLVFLLGMKAVILLVALSLTLRKTAGFTHVADCTICSFHESCEQIFCPSFVVSSNATLCLIEHRSPFIGSPFPSSSCKPASSLFPSSRYSRIGDLKRKHERLLQSGKRSRKLTALLHLVPPKSELDQDSRHDHQLRAPRAPGMVKCTL